MSKKDSAAMIPKYRFPEFLNCLNWKKEELNKLGRVIPGLTYSPQDIREKGLLVLRSSNIKDNIIDLKDTVYVRSDVKGYTLTEEKDILICVRNGSKSLIGKNALVPKGMPLCTNGAFMIVFRANNPYFVFQLFQSEQFNQQVKADLGATINSINSKQLKKYIFTIPQERKEQQKIADCLSSIDDLISSEEKKLSLLNDYKKGWMQKLFPTEGKTVPEWRFPEFKDRGEWTSDLIANVISTIIPPKKLSTFEYKSIGRYPIVDQGQDEFCGWTDERSSLVDFDNKVLIFGDHTCVVKLVDRPFAQGADGIKIINTNKKISVDFLFQYLCNSPIISNSYKRHFSELKEKTILFPDLDGREQEKISRFLFNIDSLIKKEQDKITELKKHKKALMQGLFPATEEML